MLPKFPPIPSEINEEICYNFESFILVCNGINVIAGSLEVITVNNIIGRVGKIGGRDR
jgi:hypothetical protein